tara:strand:- start:3201 stop:3836 length:636 start_codon:yes stop_codon:yes gene_type:complete
MVSKKYKDVDSPLKFLTSDGVPNAFFRNGMIVAPGSQFDGMKANEKNINMAFDVSDTEEKPPLYYGDEGEQQLYQDMIKVFQGKIVGKEAKKIMENAEGEFPKDFIMKERVRVMEQKQVPKGGGSPLFTSQDVTPFYPGDNMPPVPPRDTKPRIRPDAIPPVFRPGIDGRTPGLNNTMVMNNNYGNSGLLNAGMGPKQLNKMLMAQMMGLI